MDDNNTTPEILPPTEPASITSDSQPSGASEAQSSTSIEQPTEKPVKVPAIPKPPTYRIAAKDGKEIKKPLTLVDLPQ